MDPSVFHFLFQGEYTAEAVTHARSTQLSLNESAFLELELCVSSLVQIEKLHFSAQVTTDCVARTLVPQRQDARPGRRLSPLEQRCPPAPGSVHQSIRSMKNQDERMKNQDERMKNQDDNPSDK